MLSVDLGESGADASDRTGLRRWRVGWMLGLAAAVAVGGATARYLRQEAGGAAGPVRPLTVLKDVPEFSLTERDGRTVTKADLLGHVWVADFIFTTCTGPCPELTLRMRSLQQGIEKYAGKVKLVSFTVDPEFDRPAVLRAYAEKNAAKPSLWWFLTCDHVAAMHELVRTGFLQALAAAGGGSPIIHSTHFVLVDRAGRIRGWYDGLDPDSKSAILADVERLLHEPGES